MWYMMVKVVRKTGVAVIIIAAVFAYSEYSIKWVHVIATRDCYKFFLACCAYAARCYKKFILAPLTLFILT